MATKSQVDNGGAKSPLTGVLFLLYCDTTIGDSYTSQAQRSRVISEAWFLANGFCLACFNDQLQATTANTRARDFVCPECQESYELKAFLLKPKNRLIDGAYGSMMSRIFGGTAPNLMLLERTGDWRITGLTAIHNKFLTPNVIAERKPLSLKAKRAGWIGCNIRLDLIPKDAQIAVIHAGRFSSRDAVRHTFGRFNQLDRIPPVERGWTLLTLRVIRDLGTDTFTLGDLYREREIFVGSYPNNNNVPAKIRQQLQVLRDLGYVQFLGAGSYRLLI